MKRFLLSVLSVAAMASANADEGMWTLCNLDSAVYRQMVAEGFELSYDDLYKGDSALKNACVNFGGFCSGVVVSPDGLITIAVLELSISIPRWSMTICLMVSLPRSMQMNFPMRTSLSLS